jgi:hypothetical protein
MLYSALSRVRGLQNARSCDWDGRATGGRIILIGALYVVVPRAAASGFGLPPPEAGPNIAWWLRLKGVRDIVSGLTVLTFIVWSSPKTVGLFLLVAALIPIGDMLTVLAAEGSAKSAFGIHGLTASLLLLAGMWLSMGRG